MGARITEKEFLERAKQRFGDRFDYTGINYRSYKSPLKIRCRMHPVQQITITPEKHLQTTGGCRHCVRERRIASLERELHRRSAQRPSPPTKQTPNKNKKDSLPSSPTKIKTVFCSLPILILSLYALSAPALAGSVTAESIWNENHALDLAKSKVPKGHQITDENCTVIQVTDNDRYRCTVNYDD